MLTVVPPRAFKPFKDPFGHFSQGRAGSKKRSLNVLCTNISATAAAKLPTK